MKTPRTLALQLVTAVTIALAAGSLGGCGFLFGNSGTQDATPAQLYITNNSNEAIHGIFMSSSAQESWGPDQLGNRTLQRGQRFQLTNISPGTWDVRVVDASGNYKVFYNEQVAAGRAYELHIDSNGWTRP